MTILQEFKKPGHGKTNGTRTKNRGGIMVELNSKAIAVNVYSSQNSINTVVASQ